MNYQQEEDKTIIHVGKYLNLTSVRTQKIILKKVLALKKSIIFEAQEVNQVDTAGLQLLLGNGPNLLLH